MNALDHYIHHQLVSLGWTAEIVFRLFLAAAAGGVVGAEREIRGREAGFRTHILVCLASALVMIVSIELTRTDWAAGQGVHVNVDLIRIGYAVMTGIGFLGAGTILQTQGSVRGLTTAAAMWSVAAVGLAAGFGLYMLTAVSASMIVLTLWLFNYVGDAFPRRRFRMVKLRSDWTPDRVTDALSLFKGTNVDVVEYAFHRIGDLSIVEIELRLMFTNRVYYDLVERKLHQADRFHVVSAFTT